MESSDTESRRKCTHELLRSMCRQFEQQTTSICSQHVNQMLHQFASDKSQWKMKDCSIHLMLGIAIRAESAQFGVSQVNEGVNLMDFFSGPILTELQEPDMNVRPMVKGEAYVCNFVIMYYFHVSNCYIFCTSDVYQIC